MSGAGPALVDEAVAVASRAFRESGWREAAPRQRAAVMRRWAELVEAHGEELARLEAVTTTRVIAETRIRDVPVTAELLRFYGECADKFDGALYPTAASVWSVGVPEPYGVVGAISPWNVPMVLATAKFAPAIAAGNAVVLKPSELTPFTAVRLAELAIEAGLPPGIFNVVVGDGPNAGEPLVRHPDVACISFTGSTVTGAGSWPPPPRRARSRSRSNSAARARRSCSPTCRTGSGLPTWWRPEPPATAGSFATAAAGSSFMSPWPMG
jgi:aldehyde dehydrogenase (NAD+)